MNPEDSFDYQTIDMHPAQQNRFVWLYMEADYMQWIDWAISVGIEDKVVESISSYPDYLNQRHEDDIDAHTWGVPLNGYLIFYGILVRKVKL